jgi:predicted acetyltransferase
VPRAAATDLTLRPFTRDEFDAASAVAEMAFLMTVRPEDRAVFAAGLEFERSLAAYADQRIVSTAGIYSFELTVPGTTTAAAGVTIVTVHPAYRRRGILSAMMARQFADLRDGGESIAVLRASEAGIYGRFGYAMATRELTVELSRSAAALVPDAPQADDLVLELDEPAAVRSQLTAVYDAVRPAVPGFIGRNESAWTDNLHDPEQRREGATALRAALVRDDDGGRGYALYRVRQNWNDDLPAGRVEVEEFVARDQAAADQLWQHVLNIDLTTSAVAHGRPVDEPLLRLLIDSRRARPRMRDGLWLRLVRVGEALAARRYAAPVDLVLEITDCGCPWNAGRWRLAGDESGATCAPTTDAADLRIDCTALAAAYLGDPVLSAYSGTGRVVEQRPGALRRLAAALGWTPSPWCPHHF